LRVDICVVTYRRPEGLGRLLASLSALRVPDPRPELRVVVVDNDPERSARAVCDAAAPGLAFPLVQLEEKRRGIPQARNAGIAAAIGHADFLAFVDDDEIPDPDWLAELLRVAHARSADAVTGPCLPRFDSPPPAWIERGRFFEYARHATGRRIDYAFSGNVLVRVAALERGGFRFDEDMALTGGSDVELFRRFARAGGRIVWADGAIVHECIPAGRATLRWLLRRAFRVGAATAPSERRAGRAAVWLLAHGGWCIAKGAALLLLGVARGPSSAAGGLWLATYGAGRLYGVAGLRFHAYRRTDGH
jgi:GT2 family glycosyltransferase